MQAPNHEVTAALVRELLIYDGESGELRWRSSKGAAKAGNVAGTKHRRGYVNICLYGKRYGAHRVVWLHVNGEWPKHEIDHVNGDKGDNRIENLRDITHTENTQNIRAAHGRNSCGVLGVTRRKTDGRYVASICVERRSRILGTFDDAQEAHAVYLAAKRTLHAGCTI